MKSDKREKAIKYLPEEIRSLRLAPKINGCGPENWAEQLEVMEACLQAVRSAHFADAGKMQPLTVEQMREVVGKPYWHVGLQEDSPKPHWKILDPFVSKHPEDYGYGKRWLAYAYPPAHIDREAWVSVEDRLPEDNKDGETVLVIVSGKPHENITLHRAIMTAGYFQGEGWVVNEYPEWESPEVTYWMPLPEPYQPENIT